MMRDKEKYFNEEKFINLKKIENRYMLNPSAKNKLEIKYINEISISEAEDKFKDFEKDEIEIIIEDV